MKKRPNSKMIGLFVILGFATFITMTMILTGVKLFVEKGDTAVLYFEESIKGLTVGSPVVFKGVKVGEVTKIDLVANPITLDFNVPVFIKLNSNGSFRASSYGVKDNREFLKYLVNKGLKAKLATQSFLTGQLVIDLEILPDVKGFSGNVVDDLLQIPTVLSPLAELSKGLGGISIKDMSDKVNKLLDMFNDKTPAIMGQILNFSNNLNKTMDSNAGEITTIINNTNRTLKDVSEAARALYNFADYLERHPEALLQGKSDR